jgi:hypothetical protein
VSSGVARKTHAPGCGLTAGAAGPALALRPIRHGEDGPPAPFQPVAIPADPAATGVRSRDRGLARALVEQEPRLVAELAALAGDDDWLVSVRALDLLEKIRAPAPRLESSRTASCSSARSPTANSGRSTCRIVRTLPLLEWTPTERRASSRFLRRDLQHPQLFVQAWALDSLATFSLRDRSLAPTVQAALTRFEDIPAGRTADARPADPHPAGPCRTRRFEPERSDRPRAAAAARRAGCRRRPRAGRPIDPPTSPPAHPMTRRPLLLFVLLAYGLSWAAWSPLVLARWGVYRGDPSPYLHLIGSLGPAIAALITARARGGRAGPRPARAPGRRLARPTAVAPGRLGQPFPLAVRVLTAARLAGPTGWSLAAFGRSHEYPGLPPLAYAAASIFFYGFGEETGWRGFALPHLQRGHRAPDRHLHPEPDLGRLAPPAVRVLPGLSQMGVGGAFGWYVSILTGAVLFTWIMNSSASIPIAAVFHGTMDIAFLAPASPLATNILGALITLWGLAVVHLTGPTHLSRRRQKLIT